jgi:hypothetical protein
VDNTAGRGYTSKIGRDGGWTLKLNHRASPYYSLLVHGRDKWFQTTPRNIQVDLLQLDVGVDGPPLKEDDEACTVLYRHV